MENFATSDLESRNSRSYRRGKVFPKYSRRESISGGRVASAKRTEVAIDSYAVTRCSRSHDSSRPSDLIPRKATHACYPKARFSPAMNDGKRAFKREPAARFARAPRKIPRNTTAATRRAYRADAKKPLRAVVFPIATRRDATSAG